MNNLKVSTLNFCSTSDPYRNLILVQDYVEEAIKNKTDLLCTPECVFYRGPGKEILGESRSNFFLKISENGELVVTNEFSKTLKDFLPSWTLGVSLGSVWEDSGDSQKPYNSHLFWDGKRFHVYRKIHLFSFQGLNESYLESNYTKAGSNPVAVNFRNWKIGLSICYDLRFPELFREYSLKLGTDILLIPAAFTYETGRVHWHVLLKARAIENQSFVIAPAQHGEHANVLGDMLKCFGHSLVYDPWGNLFNESKINPVSDHLQTCMLDIELLRKTRAKLPALKNAVFFKNYKIIL